MTFAPWIAVLAAIIAFWGIYTQRCIARRKTTIDHICKLEADADFIAARETLIALATSGELVSYAERASNISEERKTNRAQIRLVLNDFELSSIAIQRGTMDFTIYKRFGRSSVLNYWTKSAPFILRLREVEHNELLYHEFEVLARWIRGTRVPVRLRWFGLWF